MANRKGKVCRFTPYPKEEKKPDLEREKTRLDIEILKSIRYKFREDKGFYAYIHYDNWTKQVTCEGRTEQEVYNKAVKYCNQNNIKL